MQLFSFSSYILLASAASTFAWSHLFERAPPGCIADNCLRAVTGTEAGQTQTKVNRAADCTNYAVQTITPSTVTVTATASVTTSTTSSSTTTTTTTSQTTLSLSSTTTTTTTTTGLPTPVKRGVTTSVSNAFPAYASPCTSAARYYSACSCAGWVSASIVTASTPTFTTTVSVTATSNIDPVSTSIIEILSTSTVDVITTSTSVSIAAALPTFCTEASVSTNNGLAYSQFFTGTGLRENTNNPSNDYPQSFPPLSTTFSGSMAPCDAALACSNFAVGCPDEYYNFDLHYLIAEGTWECVAYFDPFSSSADWNVVDSDVGVTMGYQI